MRSTITVLLVLLIVAVLSACGPSEEEEAATVTSIAAEIVAQQTADAPTVTPTPVPSPTATSTPEPTATPEPTPTPEPPTAEEILVPAMAALEAADSYQMNMDMLVSMDFMGLTMELEMLFDGAVVPPEDIAGSYTMSLLGETTEFEVIVVDGEAYMLTPDTDQWMAVPPEEADFGGDSFTSFELENLTDLTVVGEETLNGEPVYYIQGKTTDLGELMSASDILELEAAAEDTVVEAELAVEYWIGVEDGQVKQSRIAGDIMMSSETAVLDIEKMNMDVTVAFSDVNTGITIEAPDAELIFIPGSEEIVDPEALGMGRLNPYATTEVVEAMNWDIQVLDVVRGAEALQMVQEVNDDDALTPDNLEYMVVKLYAKSTHEDDEAHPISYWDFDVTGDKGISYGTAFAVDPEPALDTTLYAGEETEGWVTYLVNVGEGNMILVFTESSDSGMVSRRFIALDEGASVTLPAGLEDIEANEVGLERESAAAFGETAILENWEVTVLEAVRGEAAATMIEESDEFYYEPPEEGFEYVLVKVRARNIGQVESAEWLDTDSFLSVGELNEVYDPPYINAPEPALDYALYPGAEVEGWVVVLAAEGESGLVLIFEPFYGLSDDGQRFFALE